MSPALQSAQLFALAAAAFLLVGALAAGALRVLAGGAIIGWAPQARHRVLVALSAVPLAVACWLTVVASVPSLIALVDPSEDHCVSHGGEHAHLCFVHLPRDAVHIELVGLLLVAAAYLALRFLSAGADVWRAARVTQALVRTSRTDARRGLVVLETDAPVCFAAGLASPRVVVSRGLMAALSPEEQVVALAHERAHAARRDALARLIVRMTAALHLPGVGAWLRREVEVAAEQSCDEAAAAEVGDRLLVASTILKVERLVLAAGSGDHAAHAATAVALGSCAVERRVHALLAAPRVEPSLRWVGALAVAVLGAALACADGLHHLAESALSRIAH